MVISDCDSDCDSLNLLASNVTHAINAINATNAINAINAINATNAINANDAINKTNISLAPNTDVGKTRNMLK